MKKKELFPKDKYIDVRKIVKEYPQYNKFMIIADNGCGKTYSAENMIADYIEQGKPCAWIRNTELEASTAINGIKEAMTRNNLIGLEERLQDLQIKGYQGTLDKFFINNEGVFEITKRTKAGRPEQWKLICAFIYLSSTRSVPQSLRAQLIVLDEFIDGNTKNKFVLPDYNGYLKKIVNRITRPISDSGCITIMLANPHTPQHDLIYTFGVDFDWDKLYKGEISQVINEERKFIGWTIPQQFDIKEMKKTYTYWNGVNGVKENYIFLPNSYKQVLNDGEKFADFFMKITFEKVVFAIGKIQVNGVEKCFIQELKNIGKMIELENIAIRPVDKEVYNVYIIDSFLRLSKLQYMLNMIFTNNIYYSSDFAVETIKKILPYIAKLNDEGLARII